MHLTRRGWGLFTSVFGLAFTGRLLGLPQLWIVATSLAMLALGCLVWTQQHHVAISALRNIPEHLQVGSDGRIDLRVVNQGRRRSPTIQFADQFADQRFELERYARFTLDPLEAGDQAHAAYRIPTTSRGRFDLGPLRGSIGDPFGIALRSWTAAATQEVLVHPRVFELAALPELSGTGVDTDSRDVVGRLDTNGEFHALRDYSESDDMRTIHWKSTARHGRLMVRQDESRRRSPVTVMLDTRAAAHDEASFERAVEATASVVAALSRSDRPFQVVTTAGDPLGQPGRRYVGSVLDELAVIRATDANRIVPALRGDKELAVVAVMGTMRDADHAAVQLVVRRGGGLAIVECASTTAESAQPSNAGTRRLVVRYGGGPDTDLTTLWNRAVLAWHRNATRSFSPRPS